jgi:hypothetical protein
MKKILAVLLALVLAFGCTAIAFADGEGTGESKNIYWNCPYCAKQFSNLSESEKAAHINVCAENPANQTTEPLRSPMICPYCGNRFYEEDQYNAHIATCYGQAHLNYDGPYTDADGNTISPPNGNNFLNLSASQILDKLVEIFDINSNWWDGIEDVIIRLVDFIENIGLFASAEGDVAGAVDDLDAKVESLGIVGDVYNYIKDLINTLKQKIKDFYAGNRETEPVEETTGAEPVATGSSTIGIAAFAAVSVAAAAAYVCVKKKEN